MSSGLDGFALSAARSALDRGRPAEALEWLDRIPPERRPRDLEGTAAYLAAKHELAAGRFGKAEQALERAVAADRQPPYQQRLALLRSRQPLLGDERWHLLEQKIDPAQRLRPDLLAPQVSLVFSCGAYHAYGGKAAAPWSQFLRMTKQPPEYGEERQAIVNIATAYMARYVVEHTTLLEHADVVVSVPANAGRYADRGWSFPDELAKGLKARLALPFQFEALHMAGDVELRGLGWWERRQAIGGAITAGSLGLAAGRCVLLLDDVITSGATMREAAKVLLAAGVAKVVGLAMSHTEG
jgi:tetratricopeptide (TPR) repeat protein